VDGAGRSRAVKLSHQIEAILSDIERATPGRWQWSENGNIIPEVYADDCEIAAVYSDDPLDDTAPPNAVAIMAAVNFMRENGRALADLARRVEGAPVVEWSHWMDIHNEGGADTEPLFGKPVALVPLEGE
jgi:hypothetical protein